MARFPPAVARLPQVLDHPAGGGEVFPAEARFSVAGFPQLGDTAMAFVLPFSGKEQSRSQRVLGRPTHSSIFLFCLLYDAYASSVTSLVFESEW